MKKIYVLYFVLLTACTTTTSMQQREVMGPWPNKLYPGHNCAKVWIQACVGSSQDKYREWKPPRMYTPKEQVAIMRKGKHICEYTDKGPCANMIATKRMVVEYTEGNYE